MRLKHVKLAGFKSFVDPTTVSVPANLVGIVGPNGCGKSNVIDAIRWVMGESSAKTLRGDSMDDVIFNGSSTRKPVSKAHVELVFDNSDGSAPAAYAKFNEIAIRRELVRDGVSTYFINRTRCRRKDIHDIFLGTGLGPRSYSIIEQGMVGRIVESKPEELRVLIEEAAGISKYKERRRETENRIRHTRDNLTRVEDILRELTSQLRRLKRQSNAAERYKEYKQQQREVAAQLLTVRWSALNADLEKLDLEIARLQTEFEARTAEQRGAETALEQLRGEHGELSDKLNTVQAEYYSVGGDIAALEQAIEHARETYENRAQELSRLDETLQESERDLQYDSQRLAQIEQEVETLQPDTERLTEDNRSAQQRLNAAEQRFNDWQQAWEAFNEGAAEPGKERDVQQSYIDQIQRQLVQHEQRHERLIDSIGGLGKKLKESKISELKDEVSKIDQICAELESDLDGAQTGIADRRAALERQREQANAVRYDLQLEVARLGSLRELQSAAMGEHDERLTDWLNRRGLGSAPRLAEDLIVEPGWEAAVDCLLGSRLGAILVPNIDNVVVEVESIGEGELFLVEPAERDASPWRGAYPLLADKVQTRNVPVGNWLDGVYAANDLTEAFQWRAHLKPGESVVTRDGVWLGRDWVAFGHGQGAKAGMLKRDAEIEQLEQSVEARDRELKALLEKERELQDELKALEKQREAKSTAFKERSERRTTLHNDLGSAEARGAELLARQDQARAELRELGQQMDRDRAEVMTAEVKLSEAMSLTEEFAARRQELAGERDEIQTALTNARSGADKSRDALQRQQLELQGLTSSRESLTESKIRLEKQIASMQERRGVLREALEEDDDPRETHREQMGKLVAQRAQVEARLSEARQAVAEVDSSMRERDQQRTSFEQQAQTARASVDEVRLSRQEVVTRRDTLAEQAETGVDDMQARVAELPEEVNEEQLSEELEALEKKIERIGPVNLVAIDEYEECRQRKVYLDQQNADLVEALEVLEKAIQKIDRETRTRFKETFDALSLRFKEFFPRLFGGGSAYLELTGTDLLEAGVTVMARPPGKRNSTIHLLSGGEKALTAVALIFGFFDLNPAPFCVLDEVDAPLDDANVERYSEVLKSLGNRTQLLFITHNKITMEASNILIGITMAEPGVSRLVSVDVDQAVSMVAQ